MKTLTPGQLASFQAETTTLCRLLTILLQNGNYIRFADLDVDLIVNGNTYLSSTGFDVSSISIAAGTAKSSFELKLIMDDVNLSQADFVAGRFDKCQVTVSVVDFNNPQNGDVVYYQGRATQITYEDDAIATLQVTSLLDQNRVLTTDLISYNCTADLGDARCTVNLAALSKPFTITNVVDNQIVETNLTDADNAWTGGTMVMLTGEEEGFTMEVGVYVMENGALILRLPVPDALAAGDTGTICPGCDKTPNTCGATYNNLSNYRGIPYAVDPNAIPIQYPTTYGGGGSGGGGGGGTGGNNPPPAPEP